MGRLVAVAEQDTRWWDNDHTCTAQHSILNMSQIDSRECEIAGLAVSTAPDHLLEPEDSGSASE